MGYFEKPLVPNHPRFLFVEISHSQCENPQTTPPIQQVTAAFVHQIRSIMKTTSLLLFADLFDHKIHFASFSVGT